MSLRRYTKRQRSRIPRVVPKGRSRRRIITHAVTLTAVLASSLHARHMIHAVERFRTRIERATAKRERMAVGRELAEWFGQLRMIVGSAVEVDMELPDEVLQEIEDQIRDLMMQVGDQIVSQAQGAVRVRTGFLRDSLYFEMDDEDLVLFAGARAPYAYYQEYGTVSIPANPALTQAITEGAIELNTGIDEIIAENVNAYMDANPQEDEGDIMMEGEMLAEDAATLGGESLV